MVLHKDIGPLVAAEEMTRCIQCTRCVRFGQEIAGVMELGMINRGEHAEIVAFVGKTVDSELSGNMIDLCPVGALTSKPFRYSARTWELDRRRSISPHDGLGSNLIVQTKQNQVMRVLPLENEAINECWLSDKDRYSYEALEQRCASRPPDGQARRALAGDRLGNGARRGLRRTEGKRAPTSARSRTPHSTLEELYLLRPARGRPRRRGGLPPAPVRFLGRRQGRRALARHAGGRSRHARPGAGGRLVPAQGPSADRAPAAPGRQARRADPRPAFGRRRLADADREQEDRRAVGIA